MVFSRSVILPLLAVIATFVMLWYAKLPTPEVSSTPAQVLNEAKTGGYQLIDVDALADWYRSEREKILLVDTRREWEHRAGHIEGSVNFPMEPNWWARWRKKAALKKLLGPDKDQSIVFY